MALIIVWRSSGGPAMQSRCAIKEPQLNGGIYDLMISADLIYINSEYVTLAGFIT